MVEMVVEQQAPAMQRLQAAVAAEAAAQAEKAAAILDLAHEQNWLEGAEFEMVGRRPVRIGADDTPLVDETLPLEIAALTGTSVGSATTLIRDIVNLHHRHDHTWAAVTDGRVPLWRARQLTQVAETFGLGVGECMQVDAKIAPLLGVVGWGRVMARYRAAIIEVAPAKVAAQNARGRRNRHVTFGTDGDDPTLSWMSALADTSDVKAFEHLLGLVTKALVDLGDTDPVEVVRSKALGRMADPEGVLALLDGVDDNTVDARQGERRSRRRHAPVAQVFVHVSSDVLEEGGAARVERLGPVLVDGLSQVVGHHRIKLTPVLTVNGTPEPVVDAYEVPQSIREAVFVRDRYEVFPFSSREARARTWITPSRMSTVWLVRRVRRTLVRCPAGRIGVGRMAGGGSPSLVRGCSGGNHPAVRSIGSGRTAPGTSPRTAPTRPPSNGSACGNSTDASADRRTDRSWTRRCRALRRARPLGSGKCP